MTFQMIITLVILIAMIAVLISDKLPFGTPPIIACVLLVIFGVVSIEEGFAGFIDKNVILIASFMVVLDALNKTSLIGKVKNVLFSMTQKGGFRNYVLMLIAILLVGNLLSGTGFYVLILSLVATIPYSKKRPVSKILLPAGFATYFGGFIPVNAAVWIGIMKMTASEGVIGDISVVNYSILRLVLAVGFFVWALIGYRILPDHPISDEKVEGAEEAAKTEEVKIARWREILIYIVTVGSIAAMIFTSQIGDVAYVIPALGAAILVATGCMSFKEARNGLGNPIIFMLIGMIGVANAMSASGLTTLIGDGVAGILGNNVSPYLMVLVFTLLTSLSATFTGASFGSLFIFAPIAISAAVAMGFNPTALAVSMTIAAWVNWFMPIDGMPAMAMGLGKYKITQLWSFSVPLYLITIFLLSTMSYVLFPM